MTLDKLIQNCCKDNGKKVAVAYDGEGWAIGIFQDETAFFEEEGISIAKVKQILMDHTEE